MVSAMAGTSFSADAARCGLVAPMARGLPPALCGDEADAGTALMSTSLCGVVPAPGLLSTMTGWPSAFYMPTPTARAMESVPPPGANGTTSLTGLSGKAARAADAAKAVAARQAPRRDRKERKAKVMDL